MKQLVIILGVCIIANIASAQAPKKNSDADYFLLKGNVYEVNHIEETEGKAKDTQVIVFQDDEIYVAFNTSKNGGTYEFYLPINHNYSVLYGGEDYVNKIVNIDSRQFPSEKKPRTIKMNVGVFKGVEGYSFDMMKEPFVVVKYNAETDIIEPDYEYTDAKTVQIEKYFKKIRKDLSKKSKNDARQKQMKSVES